jgi:hypothetical protein
MSFKKNHYLVIKKAIDTNLANFLFKYFMLKRNVVKTLIETRYISSLNIDWGTWTDIMVPKTYSHYADIAMETLLTEVMPIMEKKSKTKLIPTYSYARIYKKGDILHKHKDRPSCQISTTINLGGDSWPIYLEPNSKIGFFDKDKIYYPGKTKGIKINLNPGDMLMYRGCELEHWRYEFEGENCAQVFLHYNDAKNNENIFDNRPELGLPSWFKGKIIKDA